VHLKKLKLAMAVRGSSKHYRLTEIRRHHFNMTAKQCGLGTDMEPIIAEVLAKTPSVIESVAAKLPPGFPTELFEHITGRLRVAAAELAAMPAT
jgi:serine/threonine-protein kinase HipA